MAENIVAIVGLIGSGKTTLISEIEKNTSFHVLKETIEPIWRDLFYENRKEFARYFDLDTLSKRIANHIRAKRGEGTYFLDTDMIWARETYVQKSFDEGYISFKDLNNYDEIMRYSIDHTLGRITEEAKLWIPKIIVRLNATPEICYDRQKKRMLEKNDSGEIIPIDYFVSLDKYNQKFFSNIEKVYKEKWHLPYAPQILEIDATKDMHIDKEYNSETIEKIISKLKEGQNHES